MRWYSGDISKAITASKAKGAVFVVYIEGKDDESKKITSLIDTEQVSSKLEGDSFVAIKLEANSVPHQQFSEIYKQTPIPAIYFIGKNGAPLKIVTESTDTNSFSTALDEILKEGGVAVNKNAASSSQNLIQSEQQSQKPSNVVCENGVCKIQKDVPSPSTTTSEGDSKSLTSEESLEYVKKVIEQKKIEQDRLEKENDKLKEIERRKMGQEVQKLKKWQEDQEFKQMVEEREKDKKLEKEARERVLAQIAQDKADRAAKFAPAASSTPQNKETTQPQAGPSSRPDSNTARLQFKLPDGSSQTQEFSSFDKLESVMNYIKANLKLPYANFTLSTTFPRRQFTKNDYSQTLADLGLTPNAVILILPNNSGTVSTNTVQGGVTAFIWALIAPLLHIFNVVRAFFFGGATGSDSGDASKSGGGSYGSSSSRSRNSVIHVRNKYDFDNRLKSAGTKLVVVDFFATWCGPCRMIAPELDSMARDFPNVVFLKVDVDANGDIARDFRVSSMPTFVFLKNRREVTRFSGADSYQLRSTVQRYK